MNRTRCLQTHPVRWDGGWFQACAQAKSTAVEAAVNYQPITGLGRALKGMVFSSGAPADGNDASLKSSSPSGWVAAVLT